MKPCKTCDQHGPLMETVGKLEGAMSWVMGLQWVLLGGILSILAVVVLK